MLGSKNRDFKTEHKKIQNKLRLHYKRMIELIKKGYSKEEASKIAFQELFD